MALSLLKKISLPASPSFCRLFSHHSDIKGYVRGAVPGMIRWVNSSLLGAGNEDMVVFECVTVANEGCRCLEGCYGEVLRDCVFQQGYGGFCDVGGWMGGVGRAGLCNVYSCGFWLQAGCLIG